MVLALAAESLAPLAIAEAIDAGIAGRDTSTLTLFALIAGSLWVARGIFNAIFGFFNFHGAQLVARDVRNRYFAALNRMSFEYFDRNNSGDLITRGISDVQSASQGASMSLLLLADAVGKYLFFAVLMLIVNFKLALATLAMLPVMVVWTLYFGRLFRYQWALVMRQRSVLTDVLTESLNGVRVVKAFSQEWREINRFQNEAENLVAKILRTIGYFSIFLPALFFMSSIGTVVLIWYGFSLVGSGEATVGDVISFNIYLGALIQPTRMLGAFVQRLTNGMVAAGRIFAIMDQAPEEVIATPPPMHPPAGLDIAFENVSFRYSRATEWVLRDISFRVEAGATVGIIGPTGSGKTTLLLLLQRHYRPDHGRITVGGRDIADFDADELRWHLAAVPQDPYLFTNSVSKNISFARPGLPTDAIAEAAADAQAARFIDILPDTYDTVVGERGVGLSGGQRQRVTIARALAMDAPILTLDDSTSSVDTETERLIQLSIANRLAERTSVIVSQRVSAVQRADEILVLEDGSISQRGTHEELVESGGLYAEIYHLQSMQASGART